MKKQELIKIIREAVKLELKATLPNILSELNVKPSKSNIVESKTDDPIEITKKVLTASKTNKPQKRYSKNEVFNKILNETTGGVPHEKHDPNTIKDFNGNEVSTSELPESLSRALTRNYSELLTAVDKKKGNA